jgi:glycosyltransferase involved in cell wall biosynthesis
MPSVTIISPDPTNQAGGMERACVLLADILERQGWSATIVGPRRPPTQWEFRLGIGHPVRSLSATKTARAGHPDLVVSNGYLGVGIPSRIPRVHVYHGTMIGGTKAQAGALPRRELVRRSLSAGTMEAIAGRGARRVVCVSETTAEEVRRYYRLAGTAVIPNGIDTATFAPRDRSAARERLGLRTDARYATFVGRFEHGKGDHLALEATGRAGYELLIAGPTGDGHGAHHLGVLPPEQLADAYAAADCVVFPSRYEGCSLVVLEALACGRPLITTRVGWMNTLLRAVPEYDQLCVEPTVDDIHARLRALSDLDTAPLISTAREFVLEHNSLERYGEHWRALLQGLCS